MGPPLQLIALVGPPLQLIALVGPPLDLTVPGGSTPGPHSARWVHPWASHWVHPWASQPWQLQQPTIPLIRLAALTPRSCDWGDLQPDQVQRPRTMYPDDSLINPRTEPFTHSRDIQHCSCGARRPCDPAQPPFLLRLLTGPL